MPYLLMTVTFKQNSWDASYLKLDDALPEKIRTKPTSRATLACFTRDKVSQHDVCSQGTCETWCLSVIISADIGWYPIFYF